MLQKFGRSMDNEPGKILFSHPTGNTNVRALLKSSAATNTLEAFITTIAIEENASWLNFLPEPVREELIRRTFPLDFRLIITHPLRELVRLILPRMGLGIKLQKPDSWAHINSVYRDLDRFTATFLKKSGIQNNIRAVYAYEDGAYETFLQAKKLRIECIYELPIAYWQTLRRLLLLEADRMPAWAITLKGGIDDSGAKLDRKTREIELADKIVVPSKFVAESLPASAINKPVLLAPFGSPSSPHSTGKRKITRKPDTSNKLKVLFVGSMTQRKGLGDLFEAMKILSGLAVELIVLGSLQAPIEFYRNQYKHFIYQQGRTHQGVLELMRDADIFCLPSIVEGRALVLQEAMSQGLPLIITPNTGGADLIIEGKTGFLVEAGNAIAIAKKINWFYENWEQIDLMSTNARKHALNYTWEKYALSILTLIEA